MAILGDGHLAVVILVLTEILDYLIEKLAKAKS